MKVQFALKIASIRTPDITGQTGVGPMAEGLELSVSAEVAPNEMKEYAEMVMAQTKALAEMFGTKKEIDLT